LRRHGKKNVGAGGRAEGVGAGGEKCKRKPKKRRGFPRGRRNPKGGKGYGLLCWGLWVFYDYVTDKGRPLGHGPKRRRGGIAGFGPKPR